VFGVCVPSRFFSRVVFGVCVAKSISNVVFGVCFSCSTFRRVLGRSVKSALASCLLTFHDRDRFQAGSPSWTVTDFDSISASLVWTFLSRPQDVDIVVCQSGQGRSSGIPARATTINARILRLRPEEVRRPVVCNTHTCPVHS
jgi:hypothetical protein